MARNEEKHFGKLNRLYLMKEKEEYEKKYPARPKLDTLYTPEEIQKWLPSIKRDIDFYLKKSQVTCYSDAHVEDCREKVIKLEKEFKAFVRKIKKLSPSPLEVIPWTTRPYKRKKLDAEVSTKKLNEQFTPIETPILDNEKSLTLEYSLDTVIDLAPMNEPLNFSFKSTKYEQGFSVNERQVDSQFNAFGSCFINSSDRKFNCNKEHFLKDKININEINENFTPKNSKRKDSNFDVISKIKIVNYDSSDNEDS